MHNRRKCLSLVGAGIVGMGFAPLGLVSTPSPDRNFSQPILEFAINKASHVFAVEILSKVEDEISDGEVSLTYHTRIAKVTTALKGGDPGKDIHVSIGRFSNAPELETKKGTKLVLFLDPYQGNGTLGESTKPFVTIDLWFGAMPYSEVLVAELKKMQPIDEPLPKDRLDPTPLRHTPKP